jgi:hypothetical protein
LWSVGRSKEFEGSKKVARGREFWRRILREAAAVVVLMMMMTMIMAMIIAYE